ncbi:MAG: sensor histidine kinase [Erysipelotrichaceae bacterium]
MLYFTFFALGLLIVLFLLQSILIVPFYESQNSIKTQELVNSISRGLKDSSFTGDALNRITYQTSSCVIITNNRHDIIYKADNIGDSCALNNNVIFSIDSAIAELADSSDSFSKIVDFEYTNQANVIIGQKVKANLISYYVFASSPIVPISSTIDIIQQLLLITSAFAIVIAIVVAWFFSKAISKPLVKIKNEASKLAQGNYNIEFKAEGYSEINDLSTTLNMASNRLSKLDKIREEMFANISHDLKTPLTNIKLYSELIEEISGDDPTKRQEHLDIITKEANYLTQLVDDMENSNAEQITLNITRFCLSDELLQLLDVVLVANIDRPVRFESYIEADIFILGDRVKLNQVVRNFLNNAITHNADIKDLVIELNLVKKGNCVIVSVIDNGYGINEKDIATIWNRYYRGSSNFHRQDSGSGLGLAIAKNILERHNFVFGTESIENERTCFYFEIPLEK